jgi:hypothetical protein
VVIDSLGRVYAWDRPPGRKPVYDAVMTEKVSLRLTVGQKRALLSIAARERKTYHGLIRDAIDVYLADAGDDEMFGEDRS